MHFVNYLKYILFYALTFLLPLSALCANSYKFKNFSKKNGLAHTHVLTTFKDSKGFIWVSTYGGLQLFNGSSFHTFRWSYKDSTAVSHNVTNVIFEDNKGYMWFGTDEGLNKYDRKTGIFTKFFPNVDVSSISNATVKAIIQDSLGNFWIGTSGGGINLFNPNDKKFHHFSSEKLGIKNKGFDFINCLLQENDSVLWVGTESGGLFTFNLKTKKIIQQYKHFYNSTSDDNQIVSALYKDKNNNIWIGTWSAGLYKYDKVTNTFHNQKWSTENGVHLSIRSITEDKDGNLWVGHFGEGLSLIKHNGFSPIRFKYDKNNKQGISNNFLWDINIDNENILWIGTFGGGLNKINLNHQEIPLIQIPNQINHTNAGISAILQDNKGIVWLGTLESELYKYEIATNTISSFNYTHIKENKPIHCIYEDRDSQLWIGTTFGLFKIDSSRLKVSSYLLSFSNEKHVDDKQINCIYQDKHKNIWIGSNNVGLAKLSYEQFSNKLGGQLKPIVFKHNENDSLSISSNVINCISEDNAGKLWIGTASHLDMFDPETGTAKKILAYSIGSLIMDTNNIIWVGTYGNGFFKINTSGKILKAYTNIGDISFQGSANSTILAMKADTANKIWLSTDYGISVLDKKSDLFKHYSLYDELKQNALWVNALEYTCDGAILVGGIDGFNTIWPNKSANDQLFKPIAFTDFKIANQSIMLDRTKKEQVRITKLANEVKELTLSHKDKLLVIEFIALEYNSPQNIIYAYKLEGFDNEWIKTGANMRYATYSNLEPGKYSFFVKSTNKQGVWNDSPSQLSIIVSPPFWKTWWFRILLFITLLASILLFNRIRILSLKKQKKILQELVHNQTAEIIHITEKAKEANEQKLRFFTNISHEFRTPLTLILGPIEHLKEIYKANKNTEQYFSIIQKNAFRLLRLINEILDIRKIDTKNMKLVCINGNIASFISDIIDAFQSKAELNKIKLSLRSNINEAIWFDPGKIEIILYNLISNALNNTPSGGEISVDIIKNLQHQNLSIIVQDNGVGIDQKEIARVFDRFYQLDLSANSGTKGSGIGLALIKEIIEIYGGDISVESSASKGTQFSINIPLLEPTNQNDLPHVVFSHDSLTDLNLELISLYTQQLNNNDNKTHDNVEINKENLNKTALIVDDDADLRSYVKTCLCNYYMIHEAINGHDGLLLAKEIQPDIIISDIMMPIMDGIEFCNKVKNDLSISHIPVILLSAKSSVEMQLEGFETGADAFIPKPFSKKYLITRVNSIVNAREKLRKTFHSQFSLEPNAITVTSVDEKFIKRVKDLVEKNIDVSEFGVNELVDQMGISRSLLYTKIKSLTNCTTAEFIKTMRLKRACQLLEQNNHRVSEIAYMVGFNDPQVFSKVFKKQYGVSPSQFIQNKN